MDAVIREMKEETGLTIRQPHLCGVKQFPIPNGRYIVFLFETDQFEGDLRDSSEGHVCWVSTDTLGELRTVDGFADLLDVMTDRMLTEFQYVIRDDEWIVIKK